MHQGSPQQRRGRGQGRHSGNDLQRQIYVRPAAQRSQPDTPLPADFQGQPRHAIDPHVAAGHQGDLCPCQSPVYGQLAALQFPHHAGGHHFLAAEQRLHQVHIHLITHHDLGGCQCCPSPGSQVIFRARA